MVFALHNYLLPILITHILARFRVLLLSNMFFTLKFARYVHD